MQTGDMIKCIIYDWIVDETITIFYFKIYQF